MRASSILTAFLLVVAAASSSASVQQEKNPLTALVRKALNDLSVALIWKDNATSTYAAVAPAARTALDKMVEFRTQKSSAIPQSAAYQGTLERLVTEADYLAGVTGADGYQPGVLDSEMFLHGSVDEWRAQINWLVRKLYQQPIQGQVVYFGSQASGIGRDSAPGTTFWDLSDGPELTVLPIGTYTAGSTDAEHEKWNVPKKRRGFETPLRQVTISTPIAIGTTEVTVGQFHRFVQETGYEQRGGARWWDPEDSSVMTFNADLNYLDPGFDQGWDEPVLAVTIQDARAYASWLSDKTGESYRLPTEDEWEWAARGGVNTTFYWGDELTHVDIYANTFDIRAKATNGFPWANTDVDDGFAHTAPVATFEPNGYGLYDVTGNAREFTADTWVRDLSGAASDGSAHHGRVPFPVLRGGAWNYRPQNLRLDYRSAYFSSEVATNMFGFRLVRDLKDDIRDYASRHNLV